MGPINLEELKKQMAEVKQRQSVLTAAGGGLLNRDNSYSTMKPPLHQLTMDP